MLKFGPFRVILTIWPKFGFWPEISGQLAALLKLQSCRFDGVIISYYNGVRLFKYVEIRLRNVGMLGLDGSRQCMNVGLLAVNNLPKLVS